MHTGAEAVVIVADDREWSSGVIDALERIPDVGVIISRLPLGDYRVGATTAARIRWAVSEEMGYYGEQVDFPI